jgi:hypothetical protein
VAFAVWDGAHDEAGDDPGAEVTAAARAEFIAEHLAIVAGPLARRLAAAGVEHLAAAAELLAARVPASPVDAPTAPDPDDDGCGTCGLA